MLASKAGGYMTGAEISVDGGRNLVSRTRTGDASLRERWLC